MGIKTGIMAGAGFFFTALGAIGLLIPVWPTTPFLILATGCFSATPKIRRKMMQIPFFGEHIVNYQNRTGLSGRSVLVSLAFLWIMMGISCFLVRKMWLAALLITIGILVTIHILYMARPKT